MKYTLKCTLKYTIIPFIIVVRFSWRLMDFKHLSNATADALVHSRNQDIDSYIAHHTQLTDVFHLSWYVSYSCKCMEYTLKCSLIHFIIIFNISCKLQLKINELWAPQLYACWCPGAVQAPGHQQPHSCPHPHLIFPENTTTLHQQHEYLSAKWLRFLMSISVNRSPLNSDKGESGPSK